MTVRKIANFFDKLEDKIRAKLSRYPVLYALLGGVGIVLFWRGVWHGADYLTMIVWGDSKISMSFIDGALSFITGTLILLITGVFVSAFVGNRLIITGLRGEKKLAEKTEEEIKTEEGQIKKIESALNRVEKKIDQIEEELDKR